jgi:hypothetical protein
LKTVAKHNMHMVDWLADLIDSLMATHGRIVRRCAHVMAAAGRIGHERARRRWGRWAHSPQRIRLDLLRAAYGGCRAHRAQEGLWTDKGRVETLLRHLRAIHHATELASRELSVRVADKIDLEHQDWLVVAEARQLNYRYASRRQRAAIDAATDGEGE